MAIDQQPTSGLSCSFCKKTQREVRKLIAGAGVCICDECIGLCSDIIAEEAELDSTRAAPSASPPAGDPVEGGEPDWPTAVSMAARRLSDLCAAVGVPQPIRAAATELSDLLKAGPLSTRR